MLVALAAARMTWLQSPALRDEAHYWPSALFLTNTDLPWTERLYRYGELCTPLWLVIGGAVGRALEWGPDGGLAAGRLVSVAATLLLLALFLGSARGRARRVAAAAVGMVAFPYFVGLSVHFYPDALAGMLTLAGLVAMLRDRPWLSAIAFALAVSTRQYLVAFPAAIALWHLSLPHAAEATSEPLRRDKPSRSFVAAGAMLIPIAVLTAWFLFWGGFGPPAEVARQRISTAELGRWFPHQSLYALACIGAYIVLPSWILARHTMIRRVRWRVGLAIGAVLVLAFVAFPPLRNIDYVVEVMGHLDRLVRWLTRDSDAARLVIFFMLAWIAAVRFSRWSLASALVWVHVLLMAKAHFAWDKYHYPLIICLWFLAADEREELDAPAKQLR